MAKQAWESVVAYRLVWLKLSLMMSMPMIAQFLAITQTVDMDVKWAQMGTFGRWSFFLGILMPGFATFLSMFDDSAHKAKIDLDRKRSGNTAFFTKVDTGP